MTLYQKLSNRKRRENMENKKKKQYVDAFAKQSGQRISPWKRFFAYVIDWYIATMFAGIPIVFITSAVLKTTEVSHDLRNLPKTWAIFAGCVAILVYIGYYVITQTKVYPNQTLGKRLMHIQVVKEDGSNLDVATILKREVIGVMLIEGYLANSSSYFHQIIEILTGMPTLGVITYVFSIISFVSVLMGLLSPSKKMIHDYIAKTKEEKVEERCDSTF